MTNSKLKLTPSKTEFLIIGSKKQREKFQHLFPISLFDQEFVPKDSARNLGVLLDCDFNFRKHISQTCKACFYHIRDLRRIRKSISLDTAKSIASALITSRLDYCNSLLYNVSECNLARLQRVQNCLARVVCRTSRFCRSQPLLKSLHWLPVRYRIKYKLCTITFKALANKEPSYLHDLLKPAINSRQLRSSNNNNLSIPRVKTKWGSRAFSIAAPFLWNSLPAELKKVKTLPSFRKMLKSHLFGEAFPS